MNKITKNITKSLKTTIIGLMIIGASVVSVFTVEGTNWFDASIGIAIGAAFMMAPDKLLERITGFRGSDSGSCDNDRLPPTP